MPSGRPQARIAGSITRTQRSANDNGKADFAGKAQEAGGYSRKAARKWAPYSMIWRKKARQRARYALMRAFSNQNLRPKPVSQPDGPEQGNWPEAAVYRTVTVTARRFWAQDCSSEPNADGRSLP